MPGCYTYYPDSLKLLQKHKFCTLDQVQRFINTYAYTNYEWHTRQFRDLMKTNFTSLRMEAPFSRSTRFPESFYIDMDCANIRTVTVQFFNALFVLDLWDINLVKYTSANIMEYKSNFAINKQLCVEAFIKFADIIMDTDNKKFEENGIYCRKTFEKKYELSWQC